VRQRERAETRFTSDLSSNCRLNAHLGEEEGPSTVYIKIEKNEEAHGLCTSKPKDFRLYLILIFIVMRREPWTYNGWTSCHFGCNNMNTPSCQKSYVACRQRFMTLSRAGCTPTDVSVHSSKTSENVDYTTKGRYRVGEASPKRLM
jgi:hypothetical protein